MTPAVVKTRPTNSRRVISRERVVFVFFLMGERNSRIPRGIRSLTDGLLGYLSRSGEFIVREQMGHLIAAEG